MKAYSAERKEALVRRMMPPENALVSALARETGITEQTLYTWRRQAKGQGLAVPGDGKNPEVWSSDAERLVAGRERIYLDRFWDEFAGDPSKIDEPTRAHYSALYALPGAMHSAFAQFLSFPQDVKDNRVSMASKLTMPVLAIGGGKSFGAMEAVVMRSAARNVTQLVIEDSGHW